MDSDINVIGLLALLGYGLAAALMVALARWLEKSFGGNMVLIGIDPGKHTGFAVWDCEEQSFLELESYDFWTAYHEGIGWWSRARMEERKFMIRVENPGGNKPTFGRQKLSKKALDRKAQNVGMNKQYAILLMEGWTRAGILVQPIVPKQSKWDAKTFKNITGYEGRTNAHQRDAGRMVVGVRTMPDGQYQKIINDQKNGES